MDGNVSEKVQDRNIAWNTKRKVVGLCIMNSLCVYELILYTSIAFYSVRNARIASTVLATAIPSVCPSVTRRYCVKTTARSTVQFALTDSKMCIVL